MHFELLTLPEDVFYGHLFPFLKFNDLLRLRRVSKQMKVYSDGYIRNLCVDREIEINEDDRTLGDFLGMDLPASTIYINNSKSGQTFFQSAALADFLQFHASTITHLRVEKFYICNSEEEIIFYSALSNLKYLELDMIQLPPANDKIESKFMFPGTIRNLKTLKLTNIVCENDANGDYIKDYVFAILESCLKLEFLRLPRHNGSPAPSEALKWVRAYITKRHKEFPNEPNLKFYDLLLQDQGRAPETYAQLMYFLQLCHELKVKVLNVYSELLEQVCSARADVANEFDIARRALPCCSAVSSLVNIHRSMFAFEMAEMQKLVISSTAQCSFGQVWSEHQTMPKWPSLKVLDVTIDSTALQIIRLDNEYIERRRTADLLQFLFGSVQREKLTALIIQFDGEGDERLPCPRAQDIIQTCGNVTKLHLVNWMGTNKVVSQLWAGLIHLEDVTLDDCHKLGNVAFVGENKEDPTFLKLKKLKRFIFGGLELMPKITDLAFELVFRHLKLKQFCLCSREPIKSITTKGIRSLLTGEFNNHVEIFPFRWWALENVSEEEFAQLKSEFRASYML